MSGKKEYYHVVKKDDNWAVKKPKSGRASSVHKTQIDAKKEAIRRAKVDGNAEVIIHKKDGTFGERNTYTRKHDPRKSRG